MLTQASEASVSSGGRSQRSEVVFVVFVLFAVFVLFTRDYASVRLRCAGSATIWVHWGHGCAFYWGH